MAIEQSEVTKPSESTSSVRLCGIVTGTRIMTDVGYEPVEALRPGARVAVSLGDGPKFQPLDFVGRRNVILSKRNTSGLPVRIRPNAIADGVPASDVYLARDHAIFLDGKLFPVGVLVNGGSILLEKRWKSVTYWALRLERHNVILADGLAIESVLPAGAAAYLPIHDIQPVASDPAHDPLDLDVEARVVLNLLSSDLARRQIRIEFAIAPRLSTRIPRERFQEILRSMLMTAISPVAGGRVLLAGSRQVNAVEISVANEDGAADRAIREAELRSAREAASLLGGKITVDVQAGIGTIIRLRLAG